MPAMTRECCRDRSKIKIALAIIIPIALLAVLILLAVVFIKSGKGTCNTSACMDQAMKLKNSMNLDVNPCDDFYQFVCGNVLNDINRKNFNTEINEQATQNLLKLYKENINENEHKMVKVAKRLFQKCMDENDIEKDDLKSIKEVIKLVGGWPILETVTRILERNFDWVQATYKLRELGYPFSIFLSVEIKKEVHEDNYYLEVKTPSEPDKNTLMGKYFQSEASEIMARVAQLFGSRNEFLAKQEMRDVYVFRYQVYREHYNKYKRQRRVTVEEFQKNYDITARVPFNWLEFLNKLLGPQIVMFPNDYVSFQDPIALSDWIYLVSKSKNRTIGNYMIWKVIEGQIAYLPKKVQTIMGYNSTDTREEFCLKETDKRFSPSPIEIINARNLLSPEKRQEMESIFQDIKSDFMKLFKAVEWAQERDKKFIEQAIEKLTLVYGLPGDYSNGKMLDDMDVDLVQTNSDTFLNLLSQANRNLQTMIFKQINMSAGNNTIMNSIYLKNKHPFLLYKTIEDLNVIPVVPIEFAHYLEKDAPRYTRYPLIGDLLGAFFVTEFFSYQFEFGLLGERITQQTYNARRNISECLEKQLEKYNLSDVTLEIAVGQGKNVAEKLSYETYEKWIEVYGEEPELPGLDYTPRQLFWITSTYCHVPDSKIKFRPFNDIYYYSNITLASKLSNRYFTRDFNCPEGSAVNPKMKCPQLLY